MSADTQPSAVITPSMLQLSPTLSGTERETISTLLELLLSENQQEHDNVKMTNAVDAVQNPLIINDLVDGRGLACPMPLLKTKVALRNIAVDESLYVVATDPNSRSDISAFCLQSQSMNTPYSLSLNLNVATAAEPSNATQASKTSFDTIYHFIITKTDSN